MALIEGLVIRHPEGKDPLPGIAKDWDISLEVKNILSIFEMLYGRMETQSLPMILFMHGKECCFHR